MIPFASQRGEGQDLATHLMNEHDNEQMDIVDLRGSCADDLHGAFAEWEAQAHNLTRCKNYLYSLSVNPDPAQGPLTEGQYLEYLQLVEQKLGLHNQPRAVVRHIKDGREHFHAVYSRIDANAGKAVHLAFDKDKLMMVTREFARKHGLELPDGYFKGKDEKSRDQLSLYEKSQQDKTGLTKEQRIEKVTECWRLSDSPRAFVSALEENGYLLATGNRPYLVVDIYGQVNALPKLVGDKTVRTKDIRAFLEAEFPPESLPTVDEAKALIARHHADRKAFDTSTRQVEQVEILKRRQKERREKFKETVSSLKQRQTGETQKLRAECRNRLLALRSRYKSETKRIREKRANSQATGLAAFLGRITGIELLARKIRRYQDKQRLRAYQDEKARIRGELREKETSLRQLHRLQMLEVRRRGKALSAVEQRELKSLQASFLKEGRTAARKSFEHMPPIAEELRQAGKSTGRIDEGHTLTDIFKSASEGLQSKERAGEGGRAQQDYVQKTDPYRKNTRPKRRKR